MISSLIRTEKVEEKGENTRIKKRRRRKYIQGRQAGVKKEEEEKNRNRGENRRRTASGMCGGLLSVYRAPAVLWYEVSLDLRKKTW